MNETFNLYERIALLCQERDITVRALERLCGFGNATIIKWNQKIPSGERLIKVADYFNVSVDYILGREIPYEMGEAYLSLVKEAQMDGIDPEDLRMALKTIRKLRGISS
ncbi:MAG: helix-turn-helix transcriptional regulator [Lachnospiraceae bacterium]|nr:helix-turn-helix transcriptional regulator [Lachnospiraceae bacterium]